MLVQNERHTDRQNLIPISCIWYFENSFWCLRFIFTFQEKFPIPEKKLYDSLSLMSFMGRVYLLEYSTCGNYFFLVEESISLLVFAGIFWGKTSLFIYNILAWDIFQKPGIFVIIWATPCTTCCNQEMNNWSLLATRHEQHFRKIFSKIFSTIFSSFFTSLLL